MAELRACDNEGDNNCEEHEVLLLASRTYHMLLLHKGNMSLGVLFWLEIILYSHTCRAVIHSRGRFGCYPP